MGFYRFDVANKAGSCHYLSPCPAVLGATRRCPARPATGSRATPLSPASNCGSRSSGTVGSGWRISASRSR